MESGELLERELQRILKNLYDPSALGQSALIEFFGLQGSANAPKELRRVLEESIRALQPEEACSPAARCQRNYQILIYRYVQQLTQCEVAHRLGISPRHLQREQALALQALAAQLRQRYDLPERLEAAPAHGPATAGVDDAAGLDREMLWLGDSLAAHEQEVGPVMHEAVQLAEPLAGRHDVLLQFSLAPDVPSVAAGRMVLKQIILNLITTAIPCAPGGRVVLTVDAREGKVAIRAVATPGAAGSGCQPERDALDMLSRLVELSRGALEISHAEGPLVTTALLPATERIPVLAIEDNADTLRLWERYVQDTRFYLVGVRDAGQALAVAIDAQPRLIVLDVMMPGVDGWDLLARLRNHPNTSAIPVIVCTVLPQEELALSLGASAYLRKPATWQEFRAALERQLAAAAPA